MSDFSSQPVMRGFGDPSFSNPLKKRMPVSQALPLLKERIQRNPNSDKVCTEDIFLTSFLYARKMDVDESYHLLLDYYAYRERNRDIFNSLSPSDSLIKQALYDGFPGVLPSRDRKGRKVLVFFSSNWDMANYSLDVIYKAILLSLDRLIMGEVQNQANGLVILVDWTGMTLRQMTSLAFSQSKTLRLMVEGVQDCYPVRFKGIHFVNQPRYISIIMKVLSPFLQERTRKRIFMHGNNMSTLHDYLTPDILPPEFGGESPPYSPTPWAYSLTKDS